MRISDLLARESKPQSPQPIGQLDRREFGEGGGEVRETKSYNPVIHIPASMTPHDPTLSFHSKSDPRAA